MHSTWCHNLVRCFRNSVNVVEGDIIQFIPFIHTFFALKTHLYYNHHNLQVEVIIIPLTMGIHQSDPFGAFTCPSLFQSSYFIYCDMFCFMFIFHH
jgi:hypothetical protein